MRRVCNQGGGIIVMAGAARDASRQRYDKCHGGARLSDERMRHAPRVRYIVWSRASSAARLAHAGTRKASRGALLVGHRREQVGLMLARKRIRQLEEIPVRRWAAGTVAPAPAPHRSWVLPDRRSL